MNELWYLLATTKRSVTCGQCCEIFIRLQSACRAINTLKTQFQFFKFVFLAQITERNGHSLTWKDHLSTVSICCSDSRVTNFSYSSNNGPSNSKRFCTFFTSSTRYLSWNVGVCVCVVGVLWFSFAPMIGAAAILTFLNTGPKQRHHKHHQYNSTCLTKWNIAQWLWDVLGEMYYIVYYSTLGQMTWTLLVISGGKFSDNFIIKWQTMLNVYEWVSVWFRTNQHWLINLFGNYLGRDLIP